MKTPPPRSAVKPKRPAKSTPSDDTQNTLRRLLESQKSLREAQENLFAAHRLGREQSLSLQQSQRRYAELFNLAPVGYVTLNGQGWVEEANETAARLLRTGRAYLVRSLFLKSVAREDYRVFSEHLRACQDAVAPIVTELRLCRRDGTVFPVQIVTAPLTVAQEHFYLTAILDLSELLDAQAELRAARDELEARVKLRTAEIEAVNAALSAELAHRAHLEASIIDVSERERRRFGQDLHDETCQTLGGLSLLVASMAREFETICPSQVDPMLALSQQLTVLITQTRNIARNAHPVAIGGGLSHALGELAERVSQRVPCSMVDKARAEIPEDVAIALYRIAQEATTNCLKHAKAARLEIRLERSPGGLVLSIEDDGCGIGDGPASRSSMGLDIMGYRARAIGGHLAAQRRSEGGTRISCFVPWRAPVALDKPVPTAKKKKPGRLQ